MEWFGAREELLNQCSKLSESVTAKVLVVSFEGIEKVLSCVVCYLDG